MSFPKRFAIIAAGGILIWALVGTWASSLIHHRPMDWTQAAFSAAIWVVFAAFWAWMGRRGERMKRAAESTATCEDRRPSGNEGMNE